MSAQLKDTASIYLQIADMIEENILKDILLEGEQAPSTNELARLYSINPATAGKGLGLLVDEGILYKKRGLGMFVAEGAKNAIQQKRRGNFYREYIEPLAAEAANLGLNPAEIRAMLDAAFGDSED